MVMGEAGGGVQIGIQIRILCRMPGFSRVILGFGMNLPVEISVMRWQEGEMKTKSPSGAIRYAEPQVKPATARYRSSIAGSQTKLRKFFGSGGLPFDQPSCGRGLNLD